MSSKRNLSAGSRTRSGARSANLKRLGNPYDIAGIGWATLEPKFHEMMDQMDTPTTGINTLDVHAEHREKLSLAITSLLDRAQEECRNLLLQGNGEAAEEAGVKVLRLREIFCGPNHMQLIPAYLHLARSKQFLGRYGDAEDMLSLAHYIVMKHQRSVSIATKAELYQTYGLLYAADEKMEAAIKHLTCATYYLSCLHGPENVFTTFSYFDLANVFASKASMENAMALYDSVKEIWYTHLVKVLDEIVEIKAEAERMRKYEEEDAKREGGYPSARAFGHDNLADASKMLHGIFSIQKERFRSAHPSPTRAEFVLGLFLLWVSDDTEALDHMINARTNSQRFYGPRHPVVTEIEEWCNKFDIRFEDPTPPMEEHESLSKE